MDLNWSGSSLELQMITPHQLYSLMKSTQSVQRGAHSNENSWDTFSMLYASSIPYCIARIYMLARYDAHSGGEREIQRTMLELLNQLDGFDSRGDVKVILATNRIESLDPALLRPGRIDRKIEFPLPDIKTRRRIFQVLQIPSCPQPPVPLNVTLIAIDHFFYHLVLLTLLFIKSRFIHQG